MRFPFRSLTGSATLLLAALAAPVAASGQAVMTFLPVACATDAHVFVTSPYSEAGFTLTTPGASQFATWCADAYFQNGYGNYQGPGLFINTFGADASLTKAGGGTFSINAIELAYLYVAPSLTENLTFTGYLSGGGTVSQTFTIGPPVQFGTFMPFSFDASWMNLTSVVFPVQPDYPNSYQFTNIVLSSSESTVPEPASMMLLGTGLVGVFGAARRRFSKTA